MLLLGSRKLGSARRHHVVRWRNHGSVPVVSGTGKMRQNESGISVGQQRRRRPCRNMAEVVSESSERAPRCAWRMTTLWRIGHTKCHGTIRGLELEKWGLHAERGEKGNEVKGGLTWEPFAS